MLYIALVRGLYIELRGLYIIYSPRSSIYSPRSSIYSPRRSIYSPRRSYSPGHIYAHLSGHIYALQKNRIVVYILYILGLVWLYTTIYPPRPRFFTSEVESQGHALPPEGSTEDVKNQGRGGDIVVYSQTRPNIYNIYTTILL